MVRIKPFTAASCLLVANTTKGVADLSIVRRVTLSRALSSGGMPAIGYLGTMKLLLSPSLLQVLLKGGSIHELKRTRAVQHVYIISLGLRNIFPCRRRCHPFKPSLKVFTDRNLTRTELTCARFHN